MIDWKWADAKAQATAEVRMGRKFALVSGRLEITYNTGTKVTLDGPAAFVVDTHNGGLLTLGKANVRVGTREEMEREERNQMAPARRLALFGIHTPTADNVVDDTPQSEFDVLVGESGAAYLWVLRGKVTFHVPPFVPYALPENYCGLSGVGPRHDGLGIFVRGKEPSGLAIEKPRQPPVASLERATPKTEHDRHDHGFDGYLEKKGTPDFPADKEENWNLKKSKDS
jgi:hypothetical protein